MSELIQCEFCDIYIDFSEYLYHIRECAENVDDVPSDFTSYSSLFSSITSTLGNSFNLFQQINENNIDENDGIDGNDVNDGNNGNDVNDGNDGNDVNDVNEDDDDSYEDDEDDENSTTIEINDNYITARININLNLQRVVNNNDTYQRYSNLEDVNKPVKDINLVAPLISNELIPDDINCAICQELISNPVRKTLCNHYFCSSCLEPWLKELNKTCPSCLTNLEDMFEKIHITDQNNDQNEIETETEDNEEN